MTQHMITLHILSDAIGETGESVARAISSQFPDVRFHINRSAMIRSVDELREIVESHLGDTTYLFVYTFAQGALHDEMDELVKRGAVGIDLLGSMVSRIERITGKQASGQIGALRRTDKKYFDRIDAMEYAVSHDDGRHPEGLVHADVVLIGVSRTSKTPLSMYLAYRGLRTANIPLTPGTTPPDELFDVDPRRVYGLITSADLLVTIRTARMREIGTCVPEYATREYIERELEDARAVMRKIGCIVLSTASRAIEEVAQELMRYVEQAELAFERERLLAQNKDVR